MQLIELSDKETERVGRKRKKIVKKIIIIITATIFITVDSGKESGQQNILDSKKQ